MKRTKEELDALPDMPGQALPASEGVAGNGFPRAVSNLLASEAEVARMEAALPAQDRIPTHPGKDIADALERAGLAPRDTSQAGGKRKGPHKPRSPAKTVVFIERLFSRFTLAQRVAMYAMLSSVCEPVALEEFVKPDA